MNAPTMVASAAFRGLLLAGLLAAVCGGQAAQEAPLEDFGVETGPPADRDLVSNPTHTTHDGADLPHRGISEQMIYGNDSFLSSF